MLSKICHSNIVITRKVIYTLTVTDFKNFARFNTGISYFSVFLYEDFFTSDLPVKNVSYFWHFSLLSVFVYLLLYLSYEILLHGLLEYSSNKPPTVFLLMTSTIHGFRHSNHVSVNYKSEFLFVPAPFV